MHCLFLVQSINNSDAEENGHPCNSSLLYLLYFVGIVNFP